MVQIVLNPKHDDEPLRLIELQGTLETECDDVTGLQIGDLSFNAKVDPICFVSL